MTKHHFGPFAGRAQEKKREFVLREMMTNFPSAWEGTEPSVTWQSKPGNGPPRSVQVNDLLIVLAGVFKKRLGLIYLSLGSFVVVFNWLVLLEY